MKKNKITEIDGWGTLTGETDGKHGVSVDKDGSTSSYTCDDLIIAAGAKVRMLPGMSVSDNVVTYEEQILDEELPGIDHHRRLGRDRRRVRLRDDQLRRRRDDRRVPRPDGADRGRRRVQGAAASTYKKLGVKVLLSTKVENVEDTGSGVKVTVSPADGGDSQVLEADKMLAAFGFAPRVEGYGLDKAGVELTDRGAIASTHAAAPTSRASTRSVTSPAS